MNQSMSARANPYHNAWTESFMGTLKNEMLQDGCFIDDHFGIAVRDQIGIDNLTFEVDYPHSDSQWPNTRKYAVKAFADVPDDEVHKIVELNTRRLFRFGAHGERTEE